MGEGNYISVK